MAGPTTIDWGDGTAVEAGPEQGNVNHQYATPGTYQVKVCSTAEPTKCTTKPVTVPFGGGTDPTATPTKAASDPTGRTVSLAWSNMGTGTVKINWGDGTPETTAQTAPSGTATHQYAEGITTPQTITVTNETTPATTATATFTPGVETEATIAVVADGTNPMIGNATLSGFQPNTSVTINWGANGGAPQTAVAIDGTGAGTATKTYDAPAAGIEQTVTATGEQDATKTATTTFTPETAGVVPAIEVVADGTNPMIANATLSGFQPNTSVGINWGANGGAPQTAVAIDGTGAGTATRTYDAPATDIEQTIVATGEQDATKTATTTFTPTAGAPAPVVDVVADGTNPMIGNATLSGFLPNTTVGINWGANGGTPDTGVAVDGTGAGTATHTYEAGAADIAQTVTVTGEQDATKTATDTFTPTAPATTITVTPTEGANANQASLAYDNTGNGTVSIDWGDGTAVETAQPESATAKTHDYAAAGTFSIVVTDEDAPTRTGTADVTIPFP